jgi:hypothetical protein
VRLGAGAIGVRILLATTTGGEPAQVQFIADTPRSIAHRLTLVHSSEEPKGRGTAAIWLQAADGLDTSRFDAWRKQFASARATAQMAGSSVQAEVAGLAGALRIEADPLKGERRVTAGGEPDALLSVNGRDVGREVLRDYLP